MAFRMEHVAFFLLPAGSLRRITPSTTPRRILVFAAILLTLGLLDDSKAVTATSAASPSAGVAEQYGAPLPLFGIAAHPWWLDSNFEQFLPLYRDLGITGVRLAVDWKAFEPQEGRYDFAILDRVLGRLQAASMQVTAVFVTVPAWASTNPSGCLANQTYECDLPASREPQLRAAARAAVVRYPFVRQWEVWNEPEMWRYLGNNPIDYVRILRAFYSEAKAVDPSLQVAAASLVGWDYVQKLYALAPERPWDAVSFHPYGGGSVDGPPAPEDVADDDPGTDQRTRQIDLLRIGLRAMDDAHKPIWITEYGWQRQPTVQAQRLRAMLAWMASRPWITLAYLHMLHDAYEPLTGPQYYGLTGLHPPGTVISRQTRFVPKQPFYDAFKYFPRASPCCP